MSYSAKCRIDQKSYATNCRIGEMVFDELSCTQYYLSTLGSWAWNRDSSLTRQFTDTHFENSSPTDLRQFTYKFYIVFIMNVTIFTINGDTIKRITSIKLMKFSVSPSPKKGMVKFPGKGHFKHVTTGEKGTFERDETG